MCFLLAGTRVLLLLLRYDIKTQTDSRQARPGRWLPWAAVAAPWPEAAPGPGHCVPEPEARGTRRPDPAPRAGGAQTPRRQPCARRLAGGPGLFSKTLSPAQVGFLFSFGDRNKSHRNVFCERQTWPQTGALHSVCN